MWAVQRILLLLLLPLLVTACAGVERNIVGLGASTIEQIDPAAMHRVFVATTRAQSDDPAEFFSGERSRDMTLGYLDVSIPKSHQPGKIERPKRREADPARHFVLSRPELHKDGAVFRDALNDQLIERPQKDQSVLVFVHGYNTNFSTAVLRVAQFVHDTGYQGVPVLFSWASRGHALDYIYDLNSALQARDQLQELGAILSGVKARNFDVVAHSMGSLVTLEAMRGLEERRDIRPGGRLRHIVLASPDVDIDLFETQLKDFPNIRDRFTVLVSKDDRALRLSRRLAGGVSRVGATDPVKLAKLGLTVIDLSEIDDDTSTNHSKFSASPEIVQVIGRGIQDGNTLSTQATPSAVKTVVGGLFRGVTVIPTSLVQGAEAAVITLGN